MTAGGQGEPDVHSRSRRRHSRESVTLTGHDVLDDQHHKVGTVSDVLYDETGSARWAIVDPGPLRAEKFVPVEGSYMTEAGEIVIPYAQGPGQERAEGQPRTTCSTRRPSAT